MKNKNVPKCIREGIFCLMTGAMVFMGSGLDAHAAEELPTEDPISTELDTSTNLATAEAKELVSIPSEPTSSETTIVDNVTTIENTYVESTETATATTEETTTIVTDSVENLTKDTNNQIVPKIIIIVYRIKEKTSIIFKIINVIVNNVCLHLILALMY